MSLLLFFGGAGTVSVVFPGGTPPQIVGVLASVPVLVAVAPTPDSTVNAPTPSDSGSAPVPRLAVSAPRPRT